MQWVKTLVQKGTLPQSEEKVREDKPDDAVIDVHKPEPEVEPVHRPGEFFPVKVTIGQSLIN